MKHLLVALTLVVCGLVASGTAQASLFPPYTQFIVANQLAPDAVPGGCFYVGSEPITPLVHANLTCSAIPGLGPLGTFASFRTGSQGGTTTISSGSATALPVGNGNACGYYEIDTTRTGHTTIPELCISGSGVAVSTLNAGILNGQSASIVSPGAPTAPMLAFGDDAGVNDLDMFAISIPAAAGGGATIATNSTLGGVFPGAISGLQLFSGAGITTFDSHGDIAVSGIITSVTYTAGGSTTGINPAFSNGAPVGGQLAYTYHCISTPAAGITATGASTSLVFPSASQVFASNYTLLVNDNGPTGFTNPAVTAKSTTGFTFTSANFATDTYSYQACGE